MKANINLSLNGYEEFLALKSIEKELEKANKLVTEFDDDGCNEKEEENFDEAAYLDDVREGAGYESEWAY